MLHRGDVDSIIISVIANPLDPDNALLKIHRYDESIAVAFDVERDPFCGNDAGGRIETLDVVRAPPTCLAHLIKPSVKSSLERPLILVPCKRPDEFPQGASGNDPHICDII